MFIYLKNGDVVKMTREQMLGTIIAQFGFEAKQTIHFAKLCEKADNKTVAESFERLMNY